MRIIYISKYRKKTAVLLLVLLLWVFMYLMLDFLTYNSLGLNIRVNGSFSFSYPFSMTIGCIYINERMSDGFVETNSIFLKPRTEKFSSYKSPKGNFGFHYPSAFILDEKYFEGSDILYHVDFHDRQKTTHGFVQVWNLSVPLEEFLKQSEESSQQLYKNFASTPVTVDGMPGFFWDYSVQGNDGRYYRGLEVFSGSDGTMYRISYFVPEMSWNKSHMKVFWDIVDSFKRH